MVIFLNQNAKLKTQNYNSKIKNPETVNEAYSFEF
jgi:hypothetical protein